jgi:hypothetical protein
LFHPTAGVVSTHGLGLVRVPYFDVEVRGLYGLKFLGDTAAATGAFDDLLRPDVGPK